MARQSRFNKVFFSNEKDNVIPTALKKYINQDIPKGFEYCPSPYDKELLFLKEKKDKNNEDILFSPRIKFPIDYEGVLIKTPVELQEIIYRTQKPYELNKEILVYDVVKSIKGDEVTLFLVPPTFNEIEPIQILISDQIISVPVARVPLASLNEIKLESLPDFVLKLTVVIDEVNEKLKIRTDLNFDVIKTVDDYFKNLDLISLFYSEDEFSIWGGKFSRTNAIEVFQKNNKLYKKLKYIQEKANIKFECPNQISDSENILVNCLYQNLMDKKVIKKRTDGILTLTFDRKKERVEDLAKQFPELGSVFVRQTKEFTILNKTLVLEEYILHEGLKIKRVDIENNKLELEIIENGCDYIFYHIGHGDPYMYTADEFMKKIKTWISFEEVQL